MMSHPFKRNLSILLIITLWFFLTHQSLPIQTVQEKKGIKLLEEGEKLYQQFKFIEALDKFKEAELLIKSGKHKAGLFLNMSKIYFQLGIMSNTEEMLSEVLRLEPKKKLEKNQFATSFLEMFERLKQELSRKDSEKKTFSVIAKEGEKRKKKKFPLLLVTLGAVAVGVIIYLVTRKAKREEKVETNEYVLTVTRGEGVDGSPESGEYIYRDGTTVSYNYQLKTGYSVLQVLLDNSPVPPEGTVVMDRNHTLTALGNQQLTAVNIESHPTDSTVYLSGQQTSSTTPCSLFLTGGNYEFLITNPYFGAAKRTINIEEGKIYNVIVTLSPYQYQFSSSWGEEGRGPAQFRNAPDLAIDTQGYIYVTDWDNDRVQKFDSSGNFILDWKGDGSGDSFDHPHGITADTSNYVYIADYGNHRILKFDSNGNFITGWGKMGSGKSQFKNPYGICADGKGFIYVTDWGNDRIQKFDASGTYIAEWGKTGKGSGEFKNPFDIAVDTNDYIYVSDFFNYRIQKFDSSGNFISSWDTPNNHPRGIAIDKYGYVYVTNHSPKIQKFDSSGNLLLEWGSKGSGNGQFNAPTGLEIDNQGHLLVADNFNSRIQKFHLSTQTIGDGDWNIVTTTSTQLSDGKKIKTKSRGNKHIPKVKIKQQSKDYQHKKEKKQKH